MPDTREEVAVIIREGRDGWWGSAREARAGVRTLFEDRLGIPVW